MVESGNGSVSKKQFVCVCGFFLILSAYSCNSYTCLSSSVLVAFTLVHAISLHIIFSFMHSIACSASSTVALADCLNGTLAYWQLTCVFGEIAPLAHAHFVIRSCFHVNNILQASCHFDRFGFREHVHDNTYRKFCLEMSANFRSQLEY